MCGIFGMVKKDSLVQESFLQQTIGSMRHRGPDDQGFFCDEQVGLAQCRLSIYDITSAGHQPMHFEDLTIVFNGAIFNFVDIRQSLIQQGYHFTSNADTEVVLKAYHCWGVDCFEKFNGQWALAIWEHTKQTLTLCRDRYGIKPLYVYENETTLAFGSELKSLLSFNPKLKESFGSEFIASGRAEPGEAYDNIMTLGAGQYLVLSTKTWKKATHCFYPWHFYRAQQFEGSFSEACQQFRILLADALTIRMKADTPVCFTLSGGKDSNVLVNLAHHLFPDQEINAFSVDIESQGKLEWNYLKHTIAKANIVGHMQWIKEATVLEEVATVLQLQDLPFPSFSIVSQYLLYQFIGQHHYKVAIGGQGADEILYGYNSHYLHWLKSLYKTDKLRFVKAAIQFLYENPRNALSLANVKKMSSVTTSSAANADMFYQHLFSQPLPSLLRFEDRNSMAFGIESRLPFLDHRLVEFCYSLPSTFHFDGKTRKRLLTETFRDIVPAPVMNRKDKVAFETPDREWQKKFMDTKGQKDFRHWQWERMKAGM